MILKPYNTWPAGETKPDLVARMSARLARLPGFEIAFSQPIMDSVLDYVFDPHSALAIKVFGDDFNELRRIGNAIVGVLNTIPGVTERRSINIRRCRRSRSRSIARQPRDTASTSPTWRT